MENFKSLPPQQLPFSKKGIAWRKKHLDWADDRSYFNSNKVRKSVLNKRINYDLVNGKIHLDDLLLILDPSNLGDTFTPEAIQHYPVINSKLNVLRGEEISRRFDFKVICTNPSAVSDIEEKKQQELFANLQNIIQTTSTSEEELKSRLTNLEKEFKYKWQDIREIRANALLNHYVKEYNINNLFSSGFMDAMIVGEEIYRCDIVQGEPVIEKVNPNKLRVYRSGYSSNIEDADVLVYEDYWSLGKIIDTFHDVLKPADIKYLEELPLRGDEDSMANRDYRDGFVLAEDVVNDPNAVVIDNYALFADGHEHELYDSDGNIRVLQVFWKSRRKIKKVKSYDPETGEPIENFYDETYEIDEAMGEEETIYWVNEAWEGYKIGKEVYTKMRPREVQYNRLNNPSKCHFGFIGSFYNINEDRVFSLVDSLKPFAYLYDVVHDRLNKAIEANFGQMFELDLASIPKGWTIEKWFYYAKRNHLAVKDSFKEGNVGAATGKLAGAFAANSRGIIGNDTGNYIEQQRALLEFINDEMSNVAGITKQREGQVSNRETVGGIERSTLQSSYITEWLFNLHTDVKKRVLECFLETAKIAMRGKSKKFQYIISDMSMAVIDIDGDEFAENDYGLVVDNSPYAQNLAGKLETFAQAALQNQLISFSTMMKIFTNPSLIETQRLIEEEEEAMKQQQAQLQEQQAQLQQQQVEAQAQLEQAKLQLEAEKNIRDNETKLAIAQMQIQSQLYNNTLNLEYNAQSPEEQQENIRQFEEKLKLDKEKLQLEREKQSDEKGFKRQELDLKEQEVQIKRKQANKPKTSN